MHEVSGARAHGVSRDLTHEPVRTGSMRPVDTGVRWARYTLVRTGSSGPPAWEARGHGVGEARAHGVAWELLPTFLAVPSPLPGFPLGWCSCSLELGLLLEECVAPLTPMYAHERGVK